ncbi:5-carboxymethyl-2-hydroxymuconate Delta-isomerase [Undibacterium sp. TS12]|uniref:5-carboxymethyl-2-hydroxymuconate Delta-isomerase n=1 Tax=Undibacterium sp. TS12 TaxID=2908202 RepID=UPI001F4C96DC|nr:5-carboxymethyl-2-hydroxymuconate Delta-isomerase [Undibacterium sp. TS12]MCH8619325.1 5-carboxymethyl-2-hydroxymuconate Delta-isomerase [Undibacterium sp. TS12]
MPHLTLEYTGNLPLVAKDLLLAINKTLAESGHFQEADIKSRALRFDDFAVGIAPDARAFVHAKLVILTGRSTEVKRQLAEAVLATIQNAGNWPADLDVQLCVEMQELERETYAKTHFQS